MPSHCVCMCPRIYNFYFFSEQMKAFCFGPKMEKGKKKFKCHGLTVKGTLRLSTLLCWQNKRRKKRFLKEHMLPSKGSLFQGHVFNLSTRVCKTTLCSIKTDMVEKEQGKESNGFCLKSSPVTGNKRPEIQNIASTFCFSFNTKNVLYKNDNTWK